MVLQRDVPIVIWGRGTSSEMIHVTLANASASATAAATEGSGRLRCRQWRPAARISWS